MKSKVMGMVVCLTLISVVAFGQFAGITAPGAVQSSEPAGKNVEYIDEDGNKGMLRGYQGNEGIERITFTTQTEIGETVETYYLVGSQITEVVVKKTEYNRPKFWNEQVAKANGDNEWFDIDKSITTNTVYQFKDGNLASWLDDEGQVKFAITKAASRTEKELKRRYARFAKALAE